MTDNRRWTVLVSQDTTTYHEVVIDHSRLIPDGTPPAHLGTALCNLALADAATGTASHLGTVRKSPRVDDWAPADTVATARVIAHTADRILASETRTVTADEASAIRDLGAQLAAALHAHGTEAQRDTVDTTALDTARQSCQAISTALRDTLAASARTVTLDLATDTSLATSIANLDADTRQRITDALRNAAAADADVAILAHIRAVLTAELDDTGYPLTDAVGVLFSTMEWENGYYLTSDGKVLLADGTVFVVDFGDLDREHLTDEYGARGSTFGLAVNLRTNELDGDDYHCDGGSTIHTIFDIPAPDTPIQAVRAVLHQHLTPDDYDAAFSVLFLATPHDDGYRITDTGHVLFLDDTLRELTFPGYAAKHQPDHSPQPTAFGTTVDLLTTGTDHRSIHALNNLLDQPRHAHPTTPTSKDAPQ